MYVNIWGMTKMNEISDKKIHNFGRVNYNRFKEQVEYSYFEKDENGDWEEKYSQEFIQNDIFLPHSQAVINNLQGNESNLHKDIFGNSILVKLTQPFFTKDLSPSICRCPIHFSNDLDPTTKFLAKKFEFDPEKDDLPPLKCQYMDIETEIDDHGFLSGWDAGPDRSGTSRGGITLISSYDSFEDKTTVFGINPFTDKLSKNIRYIWCKDEKGILREYMKYLKKTDPHFLLGWNSSGFDIPYILNRMLLHFGKNALKHFGNGNAWIKNEAKRFIINHINIVDYMVLYKKFELTPRRSYKLAKIVEEENVKIGGQGKITYDGSMKNFYKNDWNGFVKYCIQDSKLVYELERKKELLKTFVMCCYMAGISFNRAISKDVSWLRIHDSAIYRYCQNKNLKLPETKEPDSKDGKFAGAYVMTPKPGLYDYITVYDVASLYPSCIQSLNISLETYRGQIKKGDIISKKGPFLVEFYDPMWLSLGDYQEKIINQYNKYKNQNLDPKQNAPKLSEFFSFNQLRSYLEKNNYCVAANGAIFTKEFRGIIPSLIDNWVEIRRKNKKLYFEYKEKYQKNKDPKDKDLANKYDTIQKVFKVRLNSLYGFLGAKWSRFYHVNIAEAVTSTGQYVIKSTSKHLKTKNPFFSTMYCDTDSCRGDSIVRTNDEEKKIEDIFEEVEKNCYGNYRITYDGRKFVFPENLNLPYYNEEKKRIEFGIVDYIEKHRVYKKLFKVKSKNGREIVITNDHSIMVMNSIQNLNEKKVRQLNKGDKIITMKPTCKNFEIDEIETIKSLGICDEYVYDIGMKDSPHTFFANDILVHNSVFLNYGRLLNYKGINISEDNEEECVNACLEIDKEVTREIEENLKNITNNTMLSQNFYKFETEDLFSKLLITSKKKYIAEKVYDKSTHQFVKNDFEIKGMDFKKSNLSDPIKGFLKDITIKIMGGMNKKDTIKELKNIFQKIPTMPIEDISFVQGVRKFYSYQKDTNIVIKDKNNAITYFPKKTPYHIAGALAANALIMWDKDLNEIKRIGEDDKAYIIFVCPTNLFGVKAISVSEFHPKFYEYFKLDVEYMMQRLILGPLKSTFEAVGYNITIEDILNFKFLDSENTMVQTLLF